MAQPSVCFLAPQAFPILIGAKNVELIGGAEVQQVIIAKGLVARGYAVSMVCLDYGQPQDVRIEGIRVLRAFHRDEGIPVVRFIWPRLTRLWACMKAADADVYYQRTAGMQTGLVAAFGRHHRRGTIFAVAGDPYIELARDRWLYEYGVRRVDKILVQNAQQAELIERNFGRSSEIVASCFPTCTSQVVDDRRDLVLWVSTMRRLKRPDIFLEVARALPQFKFAIVGGPERGDEQYFAAIRDQASRLPNVQFVGFVPYSEIDRYFDRAALFLNTSDTEGFPNTFLQAWSRGTPTVSFVDCGARSGGKAVGFVVKSPEEMIRTVGSLLTSVEWRRAEGQRCLDHFLSHHSTEHVLDCYERVLQEVAGAFEAAAD